ncbi:type II toxin-antitoxin system RelE/ParE family toxin [Xenophilus arseniciresistens]|uniref:Type II toxin-antitoxin system RelE/ParE family toxin n=1 Tax=Xenophilus arseniciresistens TaxID=1283306 RepID=A0AAE3NAV4_9BURK|nr:type II toxin-antitoxin system RelE/ParE family toxin [Xenophilus arseniciresistens]MDA7418246.1 type II toxin-antitoxin system RelE/ParE family toxin [Xenophilus arseniciresistens]
MTRLVITPRAQDDLERLADFLLERNVEDALQTQAVILDALRILQHQARVGRPAGGPLRELVIHRGRSGYLALYHWDEGADVALVLAIRHQRESGYHDDDL